MGDEIGNLLFRYTQRRCLGHHILHWSFQVTHLV